MDGKIQTPKCFFVIYVPISNTYNKRFCESSIHHNTISHTNSFGINAAIVVNPSTSATVSGGSMRVCSLNIPMFINAAYDTVTYISKQTTRRNAIPRSASIYTNSFGTNTAIVVNPSTSATVSGGSMRVCSLRYGARSPMFATPFPY